MSRENTDRLGCVETAILVVAIVAIALTCTAIWVTLASGGGLS